MRDLLLKPEVIKALDATDLATLQSEHPDYSRITEYAAGQGYWREGDGAPALVAETPAIAQAMGRCVANRVRYGLEAMGVAAGSIHPGRCGWCDYPKDVLLVALDHATWRSRYVAAEYLVWPAKGDTYTRSTGQAGEYHNPAWAQFFVGTTPSTSRLAPSELAHWRAVRTDAIARAAEYQA